MTRQEFIFRQKGMVKRINAWSISCIIIFLAILLAGKPIINWMEEAKPATWVQALFGVAFFGSLIGLIPLTAWFTKRQYKRFGVLCPGCGKPLVGTTSQIAMATGNCGNCGEKVFDEPPPPL